MRPIPFCQQSPRARENCAMPITWRERAETCFAVVAVVAILAYGGARLLFEVACEYMNERRWLKVLLVAALIALWLGMWLAASPYAFSDEGQGGL
jgi:hypothetical protein